MGAVLALVTAVVWSAAAGNANTRKLAPPDLMAVVPEAAAFSNVEEVQRHCTTSGLIVIEDGVRAEQSLESFRVWAISFYDSGVPRQGASPRDAVLLERKKLIQTCPQAVLQALILKVEELFVSVHDGSLRNLDEQHRVLHEAERLHIEYELLRRWLGDVFRELAAWRPKGGAPATAGQDLDWPIERGFLRARHFYEELWHTAETSESAWTAMTNAPEITDAQYHEAMADAASVLDGLGEGIEWWPCRGTLIALMRHGKRSGKLSRGLLDVVENDIDVMVGVSNAAVWQGVMGVIEQRLQALGWAHCWSKSSVEEGDSLQEVARYDIIYCVRTSPFYIVLDVSSYIHSAPGDYVHVHQICEGGQEECVVPPGVGPLKRGGGRLSKASIHPLGRCRALNLTVPCPRLPLDTIQAMAHSELSAACIALPTVVNRDVTQQHNRRLQDEKLTAEDVRVLRDRASRLDAMGFKSMLPYFDKCDGTGISQGLSTSH